MLIVIELEFSRATQAGKTALARALERGHQAIVEYLATMGRAAVSCL